MILKVGLTGGLASGKSTIAEGLERRGIPVRDADRMVHGLYAPGAAGARAVAAAFGPDFLSPDGSVDRRRLSLHVFHDRASLSKLNSLIHPLVREAQAQWFAELAERGEPLGVIEATLLVETGGRERFDVLVAVSAPAEMRLKRAIKRSGEIDPNEFVKRMTAQFSDAAREEVSDIVVRTDGTREELEEKIDRLAEDLRARAADAGAGGRSGFFSRPR
jgi:dephospho-CoA kinase